MCILLYQERSSSSLCCFFNVLDVCVSVILKFLKLEYVCVMSKKKKKKMFVKYYCWIVTVKLLLNYIKKI